MPRYLEYTEFTKEEYEAASRFIEEIGPDSIWTPIAAELGIPRWIALREKITVNQLCDHLLVLALLTVLKHEDELPHKDVGYILWVTQQVIRGFLMKELYRPDTLSRRGMKQGHRRIPREDLPRLLGEAYKSARKRSMYDRGEEPFLYEIADELGITDRRLRGWLKEDGLKWPPKP